MGHGQRSSAGGPKPGEKHGRGTCLRDSRLEKSRVSKSEVPYRPMLVDPKGWPDCVGGRPAALHLHYQVMRLVRKGVVDW